MNTTDAAPTPWARFAPLTGVAFVALALAGSLTVGQFSYLPATDEIASFFARSSTRVQFGAYLAAVSAPFLIWFSGSLRSRLRAAEGASGRLSAVAFGGGVAGAATIAVAFAILAAAGARGGTEGGLAPAAATVLYDVYGSLVGLAAPVSLAALVGATSVVALRTDALPSWLAWTSAVVALGLLSPFGYVFIGLAFLWVLTVGLMLFGSSTIAGGSVDRP